MKIQSAKWHITDEEPPPEYQFLVGRSKSGEEYRFHCSCLERGYRRYFGANLAPCPTPFLWREKTNNYHCQPTRNWKP